MAYLSTRLLLAASAAAALTACETVAEEATEAVGQEFVAILAPLGGGASMGKVEISLNDTTNMICSDLELNPAVRMTAGHILGPGGTVVADIDVPGGDDRQNTGDNDSDDCDNVADSALDGLRENPGAYRVHIAATSGDLYGTFRREIDRD